MYEENYNAAEQVNEQNSVQPTGTGKQSKDKASGMEMYSCIKGFVEKPTFPLNISVDEQTYLACKAYAGESPLTEAIGELIEDFVDADFKPFSKPVPDTFKMTMRDCTKKIHVYVHEKTVEDGKRIAKKQNLSPSNYYRICLGAILVDNAKYRK